MSYSFQFSPYRRRFKRPLTTHHGVWSVREGVILRLASATGAIGWGEIAPVPWFGSETVEQALAFCCQLPTDLSESEILLVPDSLPACQFGLESAWEEIQNSKFKIQNSKSPALSYSRLLPAGEAALSAWKMLHQQGFRTLKWKIGVEPIAQEL
ncbi:o-succinylbenzoate synthase, partial [Leptolyngbya sp. FACHB-36]|uniref:o-succinylbenzoate synthase n=1 Tax=Leptolyngbya sp. FACHB-36 TaxID=2692808 RepID=UPI0016805F77